MDSQQELKDFLVATTRQQRYRLAGKTLRFQVYLIIEAVVAALFLVVVALSVAGLGGAVAVAIGVLVALMSLGHFLRVVAEKPWLPMAAAFEAIIVWAVYAWWLSSYISIPHFGVLTIFLFSLRFWQRGEREVNFTALSALRTHEGSSNAIEEQARSRTS